MKTIIVTGAGGMLGTEIIFKLALNKDIKILAVTSNRNNIIERYKDIKQIKICTIDDLKDNISTQDDLNCIHCAFSRSENPLELANSLLYTEKLIELLLKYNINRFINISSQSVYGQIYKPLWKENLNVAPSSLYAMAKYSSEIITNSLLSNQKSVSYTNIRLSSLNMNARFVNTFVKNAINGENINIIGGKQKVSFIDIRDAADALIKMIFSNNNNWHQIYNIGTGKQNSIIDFATITQKMTQEYNLKNIDIVLKPDDSIVLDVGLDNSLFCLEFDWQPKYNYIDMVKSVYNIQLASRERERERERER